MTAKDGILLESGTNEVEVLEFVLDGQGFGVNVLKVQAIEQFDPAKVTEIHLAHPAVIGTYNYRDGVISLVDLATELDIERDLAAANPPPDEAAVAAAGDVYGADVRKTDIETRIVLVLEFNEVTTGFLVDGVNRIHRVSWDEISPLSPFLAEVHTKFTGSLNIEKREILVVDMERILADILPTTSGAYRFRDQEDIPDGQWQSRIPVFLAEDSVTIRSLIASELKRGGYTQLHAFDNGQSCFQALEEAAARARSEQRPIQDLVGIVVSDIEMPQMDGMTLCRRLKTELGQQDIPVVLFSSLINEQIARKCESVGADAYISKPRFNELVEHVDQLVVA